MLNKIFVFGGLAITAILVIENMVIKSTAFVLWSNSSGYILSIISTLIGVFVGYGIKGMLNGNDDGDNGDDLDF